MAGPIRILIIGDNSGLNRALDQSGSKLGKVAGVAGKTGKAIATGLAVGAAGAVALGAQFVKSASDAQQSLGATTTVFGKYADTVVKRSEAAATAIGLSANEYRELSNVVGASLTGAGLPIAKVTGLTEKLNTRAADLAATFGGTTTEAVEAISSLLRGEADPIERYGISIKESDVQARLAAKGLDNLTGSAAKQASMQERLSLLMEKSAKVSGAFGRESGTLANQQQVLGAQWENLKAKAGTALLPVLTRLATFANTTLIPAIEAAAPVVVDLAQQLGVQLAPAFAAVSGFVQTVAPQVAGLAQTVAGQLSPAFGFAAGVLRDLAPIVVAYAGYAQQVGQSIVTNLLPPITNAASYIGRTFGPVVRQAAKILTGTLVPGFRAAGSFIADKILPVVGRTVTAVGQNLRPVFDQVAKTLSNQVLPAVQKAADKFRDWWPTIQKVITAVAKVTGTAITFGTKVLGVVLPPVIRFAGFLTGTLIGAVTGAIGVLVKIAGAVVDAGRKFVEGVQKVQQFANGVREKIGVAIDVVKGIPGKVTGAIGDAASLLYNEGVAIVQGLITGIINKAGDIISTITNYVIDKIPGPIRKALGISSPSRVFKVIGGQIVDGLVLGLQGGSKAIAPAMRAVSKIVVDSYLKLTGEKIKPKKLKNIVGRFDDELKRLRKVAAKYAETTRKLAAARAKLAELRDYAKAIREAAISFASVSASAVYDEDGRTTAKSIEDQMRERLAALKAFAEAIEKLRRRKLDKAVIDDLLQQGVDGGLAAAQALVAGGSGAVSAINNLQTQIEGVAGTLGQTGASAMYDGGIAAAQALVTGLARQQKRFKAQGTRIGRTIATAIVAELRKADIADAERDERKRRKEEREREREKDKGKGKGKGDKRRRQVDDELAPRRRAQLSEEARRTRAGAGDGTQVIELRLSAETVDQIRRGKQVHLDLTAYLNTKGKSA